MRLRMTGLVLCVGMLIALSACNKKPTEPASESSGAGANSAAPASTESPSTTASTPRESNTSRPSRTAGGERNQATEAKPIVVPAATVITVRMGQAVGSKTSHAGENFSATVAAEYRKATGISPDIYTCTPVDGADELCLQESPG